MARDRGFQAASCRFAVAAAVCLLVVLSAAIGARSTQDPARTPQPRPEAFAFLRALDEAGTRGVWPGFTPASVPMALFDGENTVLRGHPSPPPEFSPVRGHAGLFIARGRHPAVTANSTREIGGVRTATIIPAAGESFDRSMLAVVEEVFHVFWLERHPAFRPDEMARYAYPLGDIANLSALLAEDEALARALDATEASGAARWAAAALAQRRSRVRAIDDDVRAYESALEMMEGTANYVSRVAVGEPPARTAERLRRARPVDGIRWRFYDSGASLCFVLDRLAPGWQARSERERDLTTVALLEEALRARKAEPARFDDAESSAFQSKAAAAIADFDVRRAQLRASVLERPGARLIISLAPGVEPFRIRRFDPVNLLVLRDGEVAHPNYLTLESASGSVELTNPGFVRGAFDGVVALTLPAGRHPLRTGIRQLTVAGLGAEPVVESGPEGLRVCGAGLSIRLRDAVVVTDGSIIRVTVNGSRR
jgi:hypothetical protein